MQTQKGIMRDEKDRNPVKLNKNRRKNMAKVAKFEKKCFGLKLKKKN